MRDQMRVLAYCAMPTHWHMLLWPRADGELARFVQRVTTRHTHRWHQRHLTKGRGHLYQARYKSFPVLADDHLLTVCRYIERNPLRAGLIEPAEAWPWSSAAARIQAKDDGALCDVNAVPLTPLPTASPRDWSRWLNEPQTAAELASMRSCVQRGLPYGDPLWTEDAAATLGIRLELGRAGRPKK